MGQVPERLRWAVEMLDVRPHDHVMEIGCGRGVAAALVCERLREGRLLALDRSATAIAAASARNAGHVAAGRAEFRTLALEDLGPPAGSTGPLASDGLRNGAFDSVLAVNVNLFWMRPAQDELRLVAGLLRPGGRLVLVYDPPAPDRAARIEAALVDRLHRAGYDCRTTTRPDGRSLLLGVAATPATPAGGDGPPRGVRRRRAAP